MKTGKGTIGMALVKNSPLYKKVSREILRQMRRGEFKSGTLPSEEQLAADLGASKHTVREALAELESLSYIHKRHGVGNLIMQSVLDTRFRIDENSNFVQPLHLEGYATRLEQSGFRIEDRMGEGGASQRVYAYREIMYAGDDAASLHDMYIPVYLFGEEGALSECPHESVFDVFLSHHIVISHSAISFVPELPDDQVRQLFHLPPQVPINTWDEVIYDNTDRPICYSKIRFNPGVFPLRMVRKGFAVSE